MLYNGLMKEAVAIHERAAKKYNALLEEVETKCGELYTMRLQSISQIEEVETLINSIANSPKEFERSIAVIKTEQLKFRETENIAIEAYQNACNASKDMATFIGGGAAIAGMAPSALMWVATTFGTASTGTAISTLSGAVATKAALAWLGGGTLAAGGGGIAFGKALLALAGPIGWSISAGGIVWSLVSLGIDNKKTADEAMKEAKKITIAGAQLNESCAVIVQICNETAMIFDKLKIQLSSAVRLKNCDYASMSHDEQLSLGALVNNTLSLAEMLNKTVD